MKKLSLAVLVAVAGFSLCWLFATSRQAAKDATLLATQQAAWDKEKANFEEAVTRLRAAARNAEEAARLSEQNPLVQMPVPVATQPTPKEIIAKLQNARNGTSSRTVRFAIQQMENLADGGTNALPAIREFLALNQDIPYGFSGGGKAGRIAVDFVVPPSLRIGLFDVVKKIGGPDAENLLASVLQSTGSGVEVAYLSGVLQEMAPDKYRDMAVSAAHNLLASANSDRNQRDILYGVLSANKDASLVNQAQTGLIQPDGQIDRSALKYLQQALGAQAAPIAAAAYNNSSVAPADKEALAKIGLFYAGIDPQATQFWLAAVNDQTLPLDVRAGLVKDLGQDGFNEKNPTAADLPIIQARLDMIHNYNGGADVPQFQAAFAEAQKDLLKAQSKIPQ